MKILHIVLPAVFLAAAASALPAPPAPLAAAGKSFGELKKLREQLPLEKPEPAELETWVDTALKQSPSIASRA